MTEEDLVDVPTDAIIEDALMAEEDGAAALDETEQPD
jgi:hypothetical protein